MSNGKEGDPVNVDDPLITLESGNATLEVPAPQAGTGREASDQAWRQGERGYPDRALAEQRRGHHPAAVARRAAGAETIPAAELVPCAGGRGCGAAARSGSETIGMAAEAFEGTITDLYIRKEHPQKA